MSDVSFIDEGYEAPITKVTFMSKRMGKLVVFRLTTPSARALAHAYKTLDKTSVHQVFAATTVGSVVLIDLSDMSWLEVQDDKPEELVKAIK